MRTLKLAQLIALTGFLSACQTTVVKVMEADTCPIPPEKLAAAQCMPTMSLQEGATYDDLVVLAVEDGRNLRVCSEQATLLRNVIQECNASIEKHNARIREINAQVGK